MHIPDCLDDSVEVESGGFADVSQGTYNGRQVAIKVVRVYVTSDLDLIRSVSVSPTPLYQVGKIGCRDSAGRGLPGSIFVIPISYRCLE